MKAWTCPEVSLVSILDADKEGFLRSSTSLIQTIGRAARNVSGQVHMYADRITDSMAQAIDETNRRRAIQVAYNTENGIDPQPLRKKIADITDQLAKEDADTRELLAAAGKNRGKGKGASHRPADGLAAAPAEDLVGLIEQLTEQMHAAAGGAAVRAGRPAPRRGGGPEEGTAPNAVRRARLG